MLGSTLVSLEEGLTRSQVVMVITCKMPTPMHSGEWSVSSTCYKKLVLHNYLLINIDVKMDWCNTNINGTELEPKVQYAQMVRIISCVNSN